MTAAVEIAPAKLNLALHVRGRLPDGRHKIETIFAFCTDGDRLSGEKGDALSLELTGPFAAMVDRVRDAISGALDSMTLADLVPQRWIGLDDAQGAVTTP